MKGKRKMEKGMAGEGKLFKMVQCMKECGKMMFLMEGECLPKRMVESMKVNLEIKKAMAMENTHLQTKK